MLTSHCTNCGSPKEQRNYGDPYCPTCTTIAREAEQGFAAEHPGAASSDVIYAGRRALLNRAHNAHRNYVDPRSFSGANGMIPIPPPDRRGTPQ